MIKCSIGVVVVLSEVLILFVKDIGVKEWDIVELASDTKGDLDTKNYNENK